MLDFCLTIFFVQVNMLVHMDVTAMIVDVDMFLPGEILPKYLDAQRKQYQPDQKFHREGELIGNDEFKTDHCNPNEQERRCMTDPPKDSHQGCLVSVNLFL